MKITLRQKRCLLTRKILNQKLILATSKNINNMIGLMQKFKNVYTFIRTAIKDAFSARNELYTDDVIAYISIMCRLQRGDVGFQPQLVTQVSVPAHNAMFV